MNFWKSFRKKDVLKQLLFVLAVFVILIPIAIWDSDTQIKVSFDPESLYVKSDEYVLTVPYAIITSAELTALPEAGEELEEAVDNGIIRTGKWHNDTWGEYYINADLDAGTCILLTLNDGRLFAFSCKDNAKTAELFDTLQAYLPAAA